MDFIIGKFWCLALNRKCFHNKHSYIYPNEYINCSDPIVNEKFLWNSCHGSHSLITTFHHYYSRNN